MAIRFLNGQTIDGTLTVSGNVQGATFNGLAINTSLTNNVANQIVRTQANGYANFGWINSVSGNHTGTITRITASNDAYLRYVTPAQFRTGVTDGYYAPVSTVSGVTSISHGNGITATPNPIISTGTLTMSGSYTGIFTVNEGQVWDPTTPGLNKGSIHIDPDEGTDHAGGAITWGASDASAGNTANAGIYIRSDGTYGTKMYLATTDSYSTGSKTALNIDHSGNVNITRGFLQISNGNITLAGTGRIQGVDTVTATTDAANKAYVDAHPGSGGTVTSVTGTGSVSGITLTGTVTSTGNLTLGGTLSASITNISDAARWWNNFGDNHGTRTGFDTSTASYGFGWRYVQGNTNGPGTGGTQFYSAYVGLGNEYPSTGTGSYGAYLAFDRNVANPYLSIRYNEANVLGTWKKISAGTADILTTARTIAGVSFNGSANISLNNNAITNGAGYITNAGVTGFLPLAGGIMSGNIGRSAYNSGYQVGGYNNVGASHAQSNPIHVIGTSYTPGTTILGNMYGIGYTRADASFMGVSSGSGWGMYVAADGNARVFLDGSTGKISTTGVISATSGSLILQDYNLTSTVGLNLKVDSGNVSAITIDNVGSTTFSGYTYFPNYLFHAGDTNTRIQFTTGTVTVRGDTSILLDGPVTANSTMSVASTLTTNGQITANSAIYLKDRITLPNSGLSSASGTPAYAIYQTPGAWTSPFPDLNIIMHTGIRMAANSGYGGFRFYSDYNTLGTASAQIMSINNSADGNGAGHVYINQICNAGASMRSPIFYDSNNTAYYGDFASTSVLNAASFAGVIDANGGHGGINITNTSILSSATSTWTGNPGGAGKLQYHSNRWYIVSDSSSNRIVQFRQDANDKSYIANDGRFMGIGATATSDFSAPIYYDSANTAYYGDFASYSSMRGVAIRGDLGSSDIDNQIFFYGSGGSTTSAIGFKTGGQFANPTSQGDGWNTYFTMDTANRGWVFRRGTGGANFTSAFTSGWILNTGEWQANTSMKAPVFYDSANTAFYLDPNNTGTSLNVAGDVVGYSSSDIRYKDNVKPIENALDKIDKIKGYTFEWNELSHKQTGKKDIGVIAQEVEEILPEIIDTRSDGYKAVDYPKLTALLIQSVKEQQIIINDLKSRIEKLEL
jgi:hypothetical protein